ncbi:TPA: hypothetical protein RPO86_003774 [Escherichia coli]|nr:hypothetical protein [Escherichia coli]
MFKLLITLINCQNGDVRQFVHAETRANKQGKLTHKCTVNIMEMEG